MVKIEEYCEGDIIHLVDDFYFLALYDDEEIFPISDEKYALELHLQEALMSSAISTRSGSGSIHHLETYQRVNSMTTRKGKRNKSASHQENIAMVKCPDMDCNAALEPQFCRSIVPGKVFDRWENALCESMVMASQKFYCLFKDCSAVLVDDGGSDVVQSECPVCHRLLGMAHKYTGKDDRG
ncbi:Detected protein of unknown function [Hibiscus syriacus]|uniref:Uncharacterized protein n=1 Tax=Hibiscus syriacus TaxID=106335 RepID=A0A6A2WD55_HIBSY|nr:Detected protein of unknown function [Hibiscus syriacus]